MEKSSHRKGTDLECAIQLIESSLLKANPDLSEKSYKIYPRKIITVDGVKHEIDLWVEFDNGNGYKSIFIYEAKNWNKKIGKNHPIIFAKKIEAAGAQKGFLVGKSFTRDAIAAVKSEPRMAIFEATESFPISNVVALFHSTVSDISKWKVNIELVTKTAPSNASSKELITKTSDASLNSSPIKLQDYFDKKAILIVNEHKNKLMTHTLPEGTYTYDVERDLLIAPDILIVNDLDIKRAKFRIKYTMDIVKPVIVSQYEVKTRGRVYNLSKIKLGTQGSVKLTLIETFPIS